MHQLFFLEHQKVSTDRVFRYAGSKGLASKHFSTLIPSGVKEVVSPFFGGGSFELHLTGRGIRVHGSDLFKPLVDLWNYILRDPVDLCNIASSILQEEDRESLSIYKDLDRFNKLKEPERSAYLWLFYCLSWNGMPFSGLRNYRVIGRDAYLETRDERITFFDRLESFYNPLISVEHRDYREHLKKFPDHFIYLDPPYPDVGGDLYGSGPKYHTSFDHEELRDILRSRNTPWILSYNDKEVIRDLYSGTEFVILDQWWRQGTNSNKKRLEVVILPNGYFRMEN